MFDLSVLCLLPGSVPDLGHKESRIPVLLVQNPGFQTSYSTHSLQRPCSGAALDYGSGWDIILPAGWSMAFWIALVYRGAKAVGLREQRSLAFEAGDLMLPDRCPDTPSGAEMSSSRAAELESAYSRRPPAKRCNYEKMGVVAPFHCPWLQLVQGWMHGCEGGQSDELFYCVRDRKSLRLLSAVCAGVVSQSKSCEWNSSAVDRSRTLLQYARAIVKVRVVTFGRGAPTRHSLICLPTKEDIPRTSDRKTLGRGVVEGPTEPVHRKSSNTKASGLNPVTVLGSTVRPTVGFVVEGGFSHAAARGSGVGFVSVQGLKKLLEEKPDPTSSTHVLVRCPHSLQYRLAMLHIV